MKKKAFAPIFIALIAVGVLLTSGGTYTGVRYYQAKKLIKTGDELYSQGKYREAQEAYAKASAKWRWNNVGEEKRAKAENQFHNQERFMEMEQAYENSDWSRCIELAANLSSDYPDYEAVQAKLSECQSKDEEAKAQTNQEQTQEQATTQTQTQTQSQTRTTTSVSSRQSAGTSTSQTTSTTPPVLKLPFNYLVFSPSSINPMGETVEHPEGHPGIDFLTPDNAGTINVLASAAGEIYRMDVNTSGGGYNIFLKHGKYATGYQHVYPKSGLTVGATLAQGDLIGTTGNLHWEFGLYESAGVGTRYCPLSYMSSGDRSALQGYTITEHMVAAGFSTVCSGIYAQ